MRGPNSQPESSRELLFRFLCWLGDGGGRDLLQGAPERVVIAVSVKLTGFVDEFLALRALIGFGFALRCHYRPPGTRPTVGDFLVMLHMRYDGRQLKAINS